jgi:WD40 repeat protein
VESFDWSGDNQTITSCGTDGTIRTWCSYTGKQLTCVSGFEFDLDAIAVTPDAEIWVGTDDGKIVGMHGDEKIVTNAHRAGIKKIICHGRLLVSLGYDHACVLWRRSNLVLEEIARSQLPPHIWARSAAFANENCIVFATFGSKYAVWNWTTDEWECAGYVPSIALNAVAVGGDGRRYAIGDAGLLMRDGAVVGGPRTLCNCLIESQGALLTAGHTGKIYNAITGEELYSNGAPVNCVSRIQTKESNRLIFGTYDGALLVFQNQDEQIKFLLRIQLGGSAVKGVCCDEDRIYCGSADGTLTVVSLSNYEIQNSLMQAHDSILNGVALCRGGFATISRDLTLRLWDASASVRQVVKSRHPNSVKCICSDRDGNLLATGSYGGTIDVFDIQADRWMGGLFRPTMSGISSIAWDERQSCFIASSYDGRIYNVHPVG